MTLEAVSNTLFPYREMPADLADCEVTRIKPWLLEIVEPLYSTAPGPEVTAPLCCFIRTVIFYKHPYRVVEGNFAEWDGVETRLQLEDVVTFEGERYDVTAGCVEWDFNRWVMRYGARRQWRK